MTIRQMHPVLLPYTLAEPLRFCYRIARLSTELRRAPVYILATTVLHSMQFIAQSPTSNAAPGLPFRLPEPCE
jgi:hypothetical protein